MRYYFDCWKYDGTLHQINAATRRQVRQALARAPALSAGSIDSQSVKTSEADGIRGFDGGKKVNGRKRQLLVDTEGFLLAVLVHGADLRDGEGGAPLAACPA